MQMNCKCPQCSQSFAPVYQSVAGGVGVRCPHCNHTIRLEELPELLFAEHEPQAEWRPEELSEPLERPSIFAEYERQAEWNPEELYGPRDRLSTLFGPLDRPSTYVPPSLPVPEIPSVAVVQVVGGLGFVLGVGLSFALPHAWYWVGLNGLTVGMLAAAVYTAFD